VPGNSSEDQDAAAIDVEAANRPARTAYGGRPHPSRPFAHLCLALLDWSCVCHSAPRRGSLSRSRRAAIFGLKICRRLRRASARWAPPLAPRAASSSSASTAGTRPASARIAKSRTHTLRTKPVPATPLDRDPRKHVPEVASSSAASFNPAPATSVRRAMQRRFRTARSANLSMATARQSSQTANRFGCPSPPKLRLRDRPALPRS